MTPSLDFIVAIPARYGASRLPGKPLRPLAGEPMVLHVARRALAAGAREVVVATDDARVAEAVAGQGVTVCMTRADHVSGTDRLAECAQALGWDEAQIVVNLQGDEPFAPPEGIRCVAETLAASAAPMATLAAPVDDSEALFDPNVVKLVRDADGLALYFSRAPIPWHRDRFAVDRLSLPGGGWLRHIGIYAYRAGFLRRFAAMPPGWLERVESLEQLRVLEAGQRIAVALTPVPFPPGVDTEADLARAEARIVADKKL
ncbi:3-deoxy-manno-octulosonate cytidylyltransferase [Rehaibacterium terrae]|jgi:3-deoxy-manno-octulosonate cytidylyltransferase (CMP-KDO synthetase)|uniref:3-deoxy-manno-octulosonate cytidylyltransferase n=1 Tax=Rehaibacterium terrae TaxID=1341696 RepID=A0A7W8DFG0_9GAMM|nr:3-deoxy-manno-octulosonate cytidylyltransferase [Rehaibacterium terrae]MBB5016204.1 3-deoxy-manno-octulosonate cytidylyltransferase (CMP-KDO synthetase) [Rehaibacterium terrae]